MLVSQTLLLCCLGLFGEFSCSLVNHVIVSQLRWEQPWADPVEGDRWEQPWADPEEDDRFLKRL